MVEDALRELGPMVAHVVRDGNFTSAGFSDSQPCGASEFRGGASTLMKLICHALESPKSARLGN